MTHRDLNANLAASGSPVDLMFDADGAFGAAFYADDEKKKVLESIVRENVWNEAKNVKSHVFLDFEKKRKT